MIAVLTILLGVAFGFGATVWIFVAAHHFRHRHFWYSYGYISLSVSYIVGAVVLGGRIYGQFQEVPQILSLLILAPIVAIPPAIQFAAWVKARNLVEQRKRDAL